MQTKLKENFCKILNDWRHQSLFCDMYLVGDDGVVVSMHKLIIASKAYLLLTDLNEDYQPLTSTFSEEQHGDTSPQSNPVLYVKGYTQKTLEMLISAVYVEDFSKIDKLDLKLQLCYFILQISELLNISSAFKLKCVKNLQKLVCDSMSISKVGQETKHSSHESDLAATTFEPIKFVSNNLYDSTLKQLTFDLDEISNAKKHPVLKLKHLTCKWCSKSFTSEEILWQHNQTMHSNELTTIVPHERKPVTFCVDCGKIFSSSSSLKRHVKTVHMGAKMFDCHLCDKKFGQKVTLDLHLASVHKMLSGKSLIQDGDSNDINMSTLSQYNLATAKNSSDFDVSSLFVSSDVENVHKDDASVVDPGNKEDVRCLNYEKWKEMTTCRICDKRLSRPSNLRKHMTIHEAMNKLDSLGNDTVDRNSQDVNKINNLKFDLSSLSHSETFINDDVNNLNFDITNMNPLETFPNTNRSKKRDLKEGKGLFVCHHCGKKFLLAEYLKKHMSVIHATTKKFQCPNCSKIFVSNTLLKRHKAVHTKKKCDKCSKVLEGQRAYKNHMKTSCGASSYPLHDDNSSLFGESFISKITLAMLSDSVITTT